MCSLEPCVMGHQLQHDSGDPNSPSRPAQSCAKSCSKASCYHRIDAHGMYLTVMMQGLDHPCK